MLNEALLALIQALFTAFLTAGKSVLPAGCREEVVALLTRLMVNRELLAAYCEAITAERKRRGVHLQLLELPDEGIPDREIARRGFGWLSDDQLADLALSANALRALADELLGSPDLDDDRGAWFFEAGVREQAARPEDAEEARRFAQIIERLRQTDLPSAPTLAPFRAGERQDRSRMARWIGISLALAASLLLAFLLGTRMRSVGERHDVLLAQVTVHGDVTRGIEDVKLEVTSQSNRRAFITIVGLAPGEKRAAIHYRAENRYLDAPPHGTATVTNLPPQFTGTTVVLVVLSDVPAGEPVRFSLPPSVSPEASQELAIQLRASLEALGIAADIRAQPLSAAKP